MLAAGGGVFMVVRGLPPAVPNSVIVTISATRSSMKAVSPEIEPLTVEEA